MNLKEQLIKESNAMAKYAFAKGLKVNDKYLKVLASLPDNVPSSTDPEVAQKLEQDQISVLITVHQSLADTVAPAKPGTILLLEEENKTHSPLAFLGPIPLIRQLMLLSLLSLTCLIGTGISPQVNHKSMSEDLFDSSGWPMLLCLSFILSAAALGASFSALFKANQYISEVTFDSRHTTSYWVRFVLGIIAGIILAELMPLDDSGQSEMLTKPILALLGGFAAGIVYRILVKLEGTVESLFSASSNDLIKMKEKESQVNSASRIAQDRIANTSNLLALKNKIPVNDNNTDVLKMIDQIIEDQMSFQPVATTATNTVS